MTSIEERADTAAAPASASLLEPRLLDRKIVRGSTWVAISYGGRQLVSFLSMLVLVRLVDPKAFGLLALARTVLYVAQVVQESGLGAALVHRRTDVEGAAATALVFSAISGVLLYGVAFAAAPIAVKLFHAPALTSVVRVLALLLPLRAIATVPAALLERAVDFRPRTASDLAAASVQAAVSIGLAVAGADVWALVAGQVAGVAASSAVVWVYSPLRPSPRAASWATARELLRYGRFVTGSNLLLIVSNSIDNVVVGRLLGATALGFYAVAFRLAELPVLLIGSIVGRVMFPIYSMVQQDAPLLRRAFLDNLQRVGLLSLPVSVVTAVAADPIVRTFLGDGWANAVPALRVLALYAVVRSLVGPAGELFKGAGRPHYNLVTGATFVATAAPLLLLLVPRLHLVGAALAILASGLTTSAVTIALTCQLIGLRLRDLARAVVPFLLSSSCVGVAAAGVLSVAGKDNPAVTLVGIVGVGSAVYMVTTYAVARTAVRGMWAMIRDARRTADVVEPADAALDFRRGSLALSRGPQHEAAP